LGIIFRFSPPSTPSLLPLIKGEEGGYSGGEGEGCEGGGVFT